MSQLEVDKVIPQSGTTLTIGDSGDTITIASGATLSGDLNASNLTSGTVPDARITGAYTGITTLTASGAITGSNGNFGSNVNAQGTLNLSNNGAEQLEFFTGAASGLSQIQAFNRNDSTYDSLDFISLDTRFKMSGTEKMRIDSSGKVSIGDTTSSGYRLKIKGTIANNADDQGILLEEAGTGGAFIKYDGSANLLKLGGYNAGEVDSINIVRNTGDVGIGETSPLGKLHVKSADSGISSVSGGANEFVIEGSGDTGMCIVGGTSSSAQILFGDSGSSFRGAINYDNASDSLKISTSASERMRIDSSGNVFISKTTDAFSVAGIMITNAGGIKQTVNSNVIQQLNRLGDDGGLIKFYQAGGEEGNISVSGATVSYNGFTGTHWSRFTDNSTPTILRGTVLESLDEMCDWYNLEFDVITQDEDGNDITSPQKIPHVLVDGQSDGDVITYNHEGTDYQATIVKEADIKHMKSKVSDTVDAKNVYGVFSAYDLDGEGYNDFYVASVGSFVVRIKANETIAKGDLLQSNGDGTAKVQTDENVKSSSFAKVLSTTIIETYEDGSYLVPCSLMC